MHDGDEDFGAMLDDALRSRGPRRSGVRVGERVDGIVVDIGREAVFVDIGLRSEAQIPRHELEELGVLRVAVGDRVRGTVVAVGDRVVLATRFSGGLDQATLEAARDGRLPVEGTFVKAVKGGLEVDLGGVRAYCPGSQLERGYAGELVAFEGQSSSFVVLEVRDGGRSVIVSRRAALELEASARARELVGRIAAGDELSGIVRSIQSFGAFVDVGGLEGLVHASEISHARVTSVGDAVSVGEQVRVKVLAVEPASEPGGLPRLKLSMKALTQAPQVATGAEATIGAATIVRVEPFGLVVDGPAGSGVVPTRELDLPPGADVRRRYAVGSEVQVVAIGKDAQGRPRYSVKGVAEAEAREAYRAFRNDQGPGGPTGRGGQGMGSLGALLLERLGGQALAEVEPPAPGRSDHARPPRGADGAGRERPRGPQLEPKRRRA